MCKLLEEYMTPWVEREWMHWIHVYRARNGCMHMTSSECDWDFRPSNMTKSTITCTMQELWVRLQFSKAVQHVCHTRSIWVWCTLAEHIMCSAGHMGHYAYTEETAICLHVDARNIWCGQSQEKKNSDLGLSCLSALLDLTHENHLWSSCCDSNAILFFYTTLISR